MLGNGARLYVDHGHPEYATPECLDALTLVAYDKAGELLMERCRVALNGTLPPDQSVRLFKNNSDHQGHSYGCHESYLLGTNYYEALFRGPSDDLIARLVPFLVSRQVVCGSGKVGSENRRPAVGYQIAQRADFFETVIGIETMQRRPIINTRDEPHADCRHVRRLHVIVGDANMSEVSTYLKVGTMQVVLAMLEQGACRFDLTLENPVAAMVQISHDPTCRVAVPLRSGQRMTAVEIQQCFAEAAQRYVDTRPEARRHAPVVRRWVAVLQQLAQDPQHLWQSLDWVAKLRLLDEWRARRNLAWSAPELKELDIRYHDVDSQTSIYALLCASGCMERLVAEELVRRAAELPPEDTRAAARVRRIRAAGPRVIAASWGAVLEHDGRGGYIHTPIDP